MKPFQVRVFDEKKELDAKRERLETFMHGPEFRLLSESEKGRLEQQALAMERYSLILAERIAAFEEHLA